MAAKAAHTTEDAWPRMLDRWRAAATDLRGGNQVPEANPESCRLNSKLSEPQQRVEEAYQALRGSGWPVEALRCWTLYWLGWRLPECLRIPIGVLTSVSGVIEDLYLTPLESGPGELVEHPEWALRQLGQTLLDTVRQQWKGQTQRSVLWWLVPRGSPIQLDGPSLGAAAATGFGCIEQDLPYDRDCLITAIVREDGSLEEVGGEKQKLEAAFGCGMRKAVVAVSKVRKQTDFASLRAIGMEVAEVRTLAAAVEFACRLAGGLLKYYHMLVGRPDANPAAFVFGHKPSGVLHPARSITARATASWSAEPR